MVGYTGGRAVAVPDVWHCFDVWYSKGIAGLVAVVACVVGTVGTSWAWGTRALQ